MLSGLICQLVKLTWGLWAVMLVVWVTNILASKVQLACAKFARVYNLHTCKYTPGMYFCACEHKYIPELIYLRVN